LPVAYRLLSQDHGESSAASQSSLHKQTGTSFEASEEAPQEAASCVRLFCGDFRTTDVHLIFHAHQAIRGPKILQEAWDKHKTVRQKYVYTVHDRECWIIDGMFDSFLYASYAALGLAVSLNPNTSGGAECPATVTEARTVENGAVFVGDLDPAVLTSGGSDRNLPIGLGRIVRDEAGQIIAVESNDDVDPSPPNPHQDLVEEVAAIRTPESQRWISFGQTSGASSGLIQRECRTLIASGNNRFDLNHFRRCLDEMFYEALSDVFRAPVPRFTSKGEMIFLQKLISKHGRDAAAMTRDRRLNPDQRTEGEIRRAIKRAGGFEKLDAPMS
jgi:nucleolar protein 16